MLKNEKYSLYSYLRKELAQLADQMEKELKTKEQELNLSLQKRSQLEEINHNRDVTFETQRQEW